MFLNLEAYKKLKTLEFTPKQYFLLITIVNALQITVIEIKVLPYLISEFSQFTFQEK